MSNAHEAELVVEKLMMEWGMTGRVLRTNTKAIVSALTEAGLIGRSPEQRAKHREYMRRYMREKGPRPGPYVLASKRETAPAPSEGA